MTEETPAELAAHIRRTPFSRVTPAREDAPEPADADLRSVMRDSLQYDPDPSDPADLAARVRRNVW